MFDISKVKTPCYVVDEAKLLKNLTILDNVMEKTGCKILLAQKAFSMYSTYPMISQHLKGTTASGLYEAKLGREEFDGEVHVYSPAYTEKDMNELVQICDHIVFNSPKQWQKFKGIVEKSDRKISCGIRCNPEYSEIETDIYNPCFKNSRLGTTLDNFDDSLIDGIDGLHFHTMCEQGSDVLKRAYSQTASWLFLLSELNAAGGVFVLPKKVGLCFEKPKSVIFFYFGRDAGLNPLFNVPSPRPVTRRDVHFMYSCPLCICAKPARSQLYVMSKRCI